MENDVKTHKIWVSLTVLEKAGKRKEVEARKIRSPYKGISLWLYKNETTRTWHIVEESTGLSLAAGNTIDEVVGMFKLRSLTVKHEKVLRAVEKSPKVMGLEIAE